jgi:hypothetical protein
MTESLPPIRRSISVSWSPDAAFRRFTGEMGTWWPRRTHSIGGARLARIVFETAAGGVIYEEHVDGRRFEWGQVMEWAPPERVKFTWHPARDAATAQEVEVTFVPEGTGTRVELVSDRWERWGEGAKGAHRGYGVGWGYVLNVWAGRRTAGMLALDVLAAAMRAIGRLRGGDAAAIARARGEIAPRATGA